MHLRIDETGQSGRKCGFLRRAEVTGARWDRASSRPHAGSCRGAPGPRLLLRGAGGSSCPQGPPWPISVMASKHPEGQRERRCHAPSMKTPPRVCTCHFPSPPNGHHFVPWCFSLQERLETVAFGQPDAQLEVRAPKKEEWMDVGMRGWSPPQESRARGW